MPGEDSLFSRGDSLYRAEEYDSARAVWTLALSAARARADAPLEARILTELGLVAWRLSEPREARALLEQSLALKQRLSLTAELSRSHNALGLVARDEDRLDEAVGHFERAVETARQSGDTAALARASGNLGLPLLSLGQLERAREAFRTFRAAGRALANVRFEANALANEATVDIWEGNPAPALARLDTARRLYRSIDYATGEQNALGQLGTAFELTGEYDRAFAAFDSSLALARLLALDGEQADLHRLIAGLHASLGDWRQAIRYYEQADTLFRTAGLERDRGAAIRGAAAAYQALGNGARARANADSALRLHVASGDRFEQLDDRLLLADLAILAGEAAEAERQLDEARRLARQLGTRGARLAVGLAVARTAGRIGTPEGALAAARQVEASLTPGDLWAEWEVHALVARAHARRENLDSAVAAGRRAVAALERLRGNVGSATLRTMVVADRAEVYGDLVLALLRSGRSEEAFTVADAARSRSLLEHLSGVSAERFAEVARGQALLRRIDQLIQRIRGTEPPGPRERGPGRDPAVIALAEELAAARSEYEAVLIRAQAQHPRAMTLLGAAPTRLDDVRAALAPDEALVEYLVTPGRILIFELRPSGLQVVESELDGPTLAYRIGILEDLWGRRGADWRVGLPVAEALYRTLIAPLGSLAGVRHLIVVPHGVIGQVPFAALRDGGRGRFLAEDASLSVLPSAAALAALRQGSGPVSDEPGEALAPFPRDLPATAREAAAFRSAIAGARVRTGARATEQALRGLLGATGPVHIATHGTLNVRNPLFSRIELARPARPTGVEDDGRLEVHELMGITIRVPLVFFSGCETGRGQALSDDLVRGTGHLTLAQAALAAGAANVVSTFWRIDDAGAAVFAARFYHHLGRMAVAEALAAAQRDLLATPEHASPYYWAGYLLSGEGRFGGAPQAAVRASVSQPMDGTSPSGTAARTRP